MDLLYRVGGLSGTERGELMGVYLYYCEPGEKTITWNTEKQLFQIIKRVEAGLSTIKILPLLP